MVGVLYTIVYESLIRGYVVLFLHAAEISDLATSNDGSTADKFRRIDANRHHFPRYCPKCAITRPKLQPEPLVLLAPSRMSKWRLENSLGEAESNQKMLEL